MGDEPLGDVTHAEQRELDALRQRAYGPDADIFDDAPALSRLDELEERVRLERLAVGAGGPPSVIPPDPALRDTPAPEADAGSEPPSSVPYRRPPTQRRSRLLIIGAVVVAVLIAAVAWNGTRSESADELATGSNLTAGISDKQRSFAYRRYIDDLRADVLALPGSEGTANRMIRDELRPYGTLYGRSVGAGPTIDHQFCMIIANLPAASVTCIPVKTADASPASVTLRAWYFDSASHQFAGIGRLVSYTLMPGGSVVAVPADESDSAGTQSETGSTRSG